MLLLGPLPTHSHLESAALTSHRGWSVFLNTLSDRDLHDPSYVDEGFFTVKAGVPSRNGVRKHAIIDGPLVGASSSATAWSISERSGATINGLWDNGAMFVNPMVGENNHSFVVTLGIVSRTGPESTPGTTIRRTGYRELFNAMSGVMKTIDCSHSVINDQPVTLQPGWAASMDINDISPPPPVHEKIVILLTARNRAARWRALIGVSMLLLQHRGTPGARRTMLRSPGCCLRCAVEQTVLEDGLWWLIL
ncbi:uncharacterized protein P174DRAFT_361822 [Aspergillus novofumigatus IBT 16806]|uniref:Uncharacterized protein n=1 Tax=Aspergillus novofumigatus (strain IBT 16806) TaxID=1392255 RepID=A0A2I1CPI2_ASPN1|nr:uncharacterized protein P174DRAFT_361822 [Aspergillus novofumigatus IBT 16806]PKX99532.1 hypothetical protein P174DRAFT_361822 [Aspergillus novofumigatus IBT 16806]